MASLLWYRPSTTLAVGQGRVAGRINDKRSTSRAANRQRENKQREVDSSMDQGGRGLHRPVERGKAMTNDLRAITGACIEPPHSLRGTSRQQRLQGTSVIGRRPRGPTWQEPEGIEFVGGTYGPRDGGERERERERERAAEFWTRQRHRAEEQIRKEKKSCTRSTASTIKGTHDPPAAGGFGNDSADGSTIRPARQSATGDVGDLALTDN
ncbi:hypothetical protein IWX50DRAFT_614421 [Phyllosticta citricarpa]